MPDDRTLANPPLIEAVIDISVIVDDTNPQSFDLHDMGFRASFPKQEKTNHLSAEIKISDGTGGTVGSFQDTLLGYAYKSADDKDHVQFRTNGYSFHKVGSYEDWEKFLRETLAYYEYYKKVRKDIQVERLAIRFINLIKMPIGSSMLDYFKSYIHIDNGCNLDQVEQLQYQYTSKFPEVGCSSLVNFQRVNAPANDADKTCFLLDIAVTSDPYGVDLDRQNIETYLDAMRIIKNDIFFNSLTPTALEMFK